MTIKYGNKWEYMLRQFVIYDDFLAPPRMGRVVEYVVIF